MLTLTFRLGRSTERERSKWEVCRERKLLAVDFDITTYDVAVSRPLMVVGFGVRSLGNVGNRLRRGEKLCRLARRCVAREKGA